MNADLFLRKKSDGLGESIGARANMIPFFKLGGRGGGQGRGGWREQTKYDEKKIKEELLTKQLLLLAAD